MKEDKQASREPITLDRARPGDTLEILEINRGHRAMQRLMHMGLTPGTRLTVETVHPFSGPVVVNVGGTKIAVGRNLARGIAAAVPGGHKD